MDSKGDDTKKKAPSFLNLRSFIAGGIVGGTSTIVGHPLDTIKIRM